MLGLQVVFETHEMKDARWMNRLVLARLLRHPNLKGIVAITGQLREDFAKAHGIAPDRIRVLPDGADSVSEASFSNEKSLPGFSVGYTGHLYPGKGMEIVLPLARRCPDMNFHVVGGTEEGIDFWKTEARHCPNLTFHGYVSPAEVGGYLAGFDVVLCPNQVSVKSVGGTEIGRWTWPLKIFEYMASGKPIVCSNLPVLCEVMKDEVNCLMCPPEEIRSWKAALERLRGDPNLAQARYRRLYSVGKKAIVFSQLPQRLSAVTECFVRGPLRPQSYYLFGLMLWTLLFPGSMKKVRRRFLGV